MNSGIETTYLRLFIMVPQHLCPYMIIPTRESGHTRLCPDTFLPQYEL